VAAALMEYYCTKDKNIAFKIFDLGLKRFKHQPDYLLAYVEFLTQLNEDNNTRVLFERYINIPKNLFIMTVMVYVLFPSVEFFLLVLYLLKTHSKYGIVFLSLNHPLVISPALLKLKKDAMLFWTK
jgi:hypothetical protein